MARMTKWVQIAKMSEMGNFNEIAKRALGGEICLKGHNYRNSKNDELAQIAKFVTSAKIGTITTFNINVTLATIAKFN